MYHLQVKLTDSNMPYNLFGEILDKAKKTYTDSSFYK